MSFETTFNAAPDVSLPMVSRDNYSIYGWDNFSSVVYNGEIYIMNCYSERGGRYRLDKTTNEWVSISGPCSGYGGFAIVYNGEIHHLLYFAPYYSDQSSHYYHCKYDGTTWTLLEDVPFSTISCKGAVYNDELYAFTGTNIFKYNGATWTKVGSTPDGYSNYKVVVYNDEIHLLGNESNKLNHYKYDGIIWTQVSTQPIKCGNVVVYAGKILINLNGTKTFSWDGTSWRSLPLKQNIPGNNVVVLDNLIHTLGVTGDHTLRDDHYRIYKSLIFNDSI